jgi:hypothetical protein
MEPTMKLPCCLLVTLIALIALSAAGVASAAKPEAYILGGPVFANLGSDGEQFGTDLASGLDIALGGAWASSKSTKTGPDLGFGLHSRGEGSFGTTVELRYVRRGASYKLVDATGTYQDLTVKLKLDYVEIPVLLEFTPRSETSVRPVFVLGPLLGIRASSNVGVEGGATATSSNIKDQVRGSQFSALLGAGMRIRTTDRAAMLVQARYTLGLTNLFSDAVGYDVKPRDISLLVGYTFDL